MPGLTDRDLRRIERFVRTPPHRRSADILVPDTAGTGEAGTTEGPNATEGTDPDGGG